MKEEHWMQLYLQAWWALTHEDDWEYSVFYRWDDMWYGRETYAWFVPLELPRIKRAYATAHYFVWAENNDAY